MVNRIHYESKLLAGIFSYELPVNIRRMNYRHLIRSQAVAFLDESIVMALKELDRRGMLFSPEHDLWSHIEDTDIYRIKENAQNLEGPDHKAYRRLVYEIETELLKESVTHSKGTPVVFPTADEVFSPRRTSEVREWYKRKKEVTGLELLVPEVNDVAGKLEPGKNLVVGGFAGSYKTVYIENIIANKLEDDEIKILWISDNRLEKEVKSRLYDLYKVDIVGYPDSSEDDLIKLTSSIEVVDSERFGRRRNTGELQDQIERWLYLHQHAPHLVIVVDSLDGIAEKLHHPTVKSNSAVRAFVGVLEHVVDMYSEKVSVLSTYRFCERTYLSLKRRTDEYDLKSRQAGFGLLDMADVIAEQKLKRRTEDDLIYSREKSGEKDVLQEMEEFRRINKLHMQQKKVVDAIENRLIKEGGKILWEADNKKSPRGQYLLTAFTDPPEIERFFHVCISMWSDRSDSELREYGQALLKVVKNKGQETTNIPCTADFRKETLKLEVPVSVDFEGGGESIDELLKGGLV